MYDFDYTNRMLDISLLSNLIPKLDIGSSPVSLNTNNFSTANIFSADLLPMPTFGNFDLASIVQSAINSVGPLDFSSLKLPSTANLNGSSNQPSLFGSGFNLNLPNLEAFVKSMPTMPASNITANNPVQEDSNQIYKIGKFDLDFWKNQGYNHEMGKKLALDAVRTCPGHADGGCVGYTRRTINRLYGTNFTNAGAAYNFGNKILSDPRLSGKFKKVDKKFIEKAGVPDGAIVIWRPGAPGYTKGKAALYGHGAIAYQNKAYADCIVQNFKTCSEVWIPV